jgi:hypothetical protein
MRLLFVGFIGLLTGCGGVVNYTEDGGEGAAGGVGGAGPSTTTSPTNNTTTSPTNNTNVTTGPVNTCDVFCSALESCQLSEPSCGSECAQIYIPGCEAQAEALLQCYLSVLTSTCEFSENDCIAEVEAYAQCSSLGRELCFTTGCFDGPGCSCTGECFGGTLEQLCKPPMPGDGGGGPPPPPQIECECYLDGGFFGTCFQEPFQCSIEEGCCRFLLSEPRPG